MLSLFSDISCFFYLTSHGNFTRIVHNNIIGNYLVVCTIENNIRIKSIKFSTAIT